MIDEFAKYAVEQNVYTKSSIDIKFRKDVDVVNEAT